MCGLLNGVIFNDLGWGWALTQISRARHYLTFNISNVANTFSMLLLKTIGPVRWRGVTFGYLIYWLILFCFIYISRSKLHIIFYRIFWFLSAEEIEFTKLETSVTYEAGNSALITCSATGKPKPQMSWRFHNRKITFGKCAMINSFTLTSCRTVHHT